MTLQELYAQIGGDYDQAVKRLMMESYVGMFIVRFLNDTSCQSVHDAWAAGDEKATFHAAHTAKGVCANLSLTKLADLSSQITEALREGNEALRAKTDVDALVAELDEAYAATVAAIKLYSAQK